MARARQSDIDRLIAAAYDAAIDGTSWQSVADDLRRTFDAATVSITGYDWASMQGFIINAGTDPEMIASYLNHYVKLDPVTARLAAVPVGQVVESHTIVPASEVKRTEYYADWLRPQKLLGGLVANTIRSREVAGGLVIAREAGRPAFDPSDVAVLSQLAPHLGRAVRTSYHMAAARTHAVATQDLVDRLPQAALLIARDGAILHCNPAAESLLARKDGLSTQAGKLHAGGSRNQAQLAAAIAQGVAGSGSIVPVETNAGSGRLIVSLQPLGRSPTAEDPLRLVQRARVLVLVADPLQNRHRRVAEALRTAYGLTGAEARVLGLLAAGNSPAEIATLLAVQVTTIRSHLKSLFEKADVSRQSELTRLFERIAAITSDET